MCLCVCFYLWVEIQDADPTGFDGTPNRVKLGAVVVSVELAVLQEFVRIHTVFKLKHVQTLRHPEHKPWPTQTLLCGTDPGPVMTPFSLLCDIYSAVRVAHRTFPGAQNGPVTAHAKCVRTALFPISQIPMRSQSEADEGKPCELPNKRCTRVDATSQTPYLVACDEPIAVAVHFALSYWSRRVCNTGKECFQRVEI